MRPRWAGGSGSGLTLLLGPLAPDPTPMPATQSSRALRRMSRPRKAGPVLAVAVLEQAPTPARTRTRGTQAARSRRQVAVLPEQATAPVIAVRRRFAAAARRVRPGFVVALFPPPMMPMFTRARRIATQLVRRRAGSVPVAEAVPAAPARRRLGALVRRFRQAFVPTPPPAVVVPPPPFPQRRRTQAAAARRRAAWLVFAPQLPPALEYLLMVVAHAPVLMAFARVRLVTVARQATSVTRRVAQAVNRATQLRRRRP